MMSNTIPDLIEDLRAGKLIILMDDEDRENEGDLIFAAEDASAEKLGFMLRHTSGIICLAIVGERLDELELAVARAPSRSASFAIPTSRRRTAACAPPRPPAPLRRGEPHRRRDERGGRRRRARPRPRSRPPRATRGCRRSHPCASRRSPAWRSHCPPPPSILCGSRSAVRRLLVDF